MSTQPTEAVQDELTVAIVGMAGRFPGAPDLESFWRNLREGVEGIRAFSDEELLARGVAPQLVRSPDFVKAGAVLQDVECFDAAFFGYSPREAALMDPQHRLFLECAWEALERAGMCPDGQRSVGVFAGTSLSTYLLFNLLTHPELIASGDGFQVMIGNDKDFLATRVAYNLDLRGPALDIQTGCSTSLVATHLACQALLGFQCDVALAGGVSVDVPQRTGYTHQPGGIASPDGHCRAFDAQAQGTVFGSGVGVVVLKRLEDALRDGDTIHALIRGGAINNDGASKLGYTAPSVEGQVEVIARAQAMAGVPARSIGYVETHGTGTQLGDPVEVSALARVFGEQGGEGPSCVLGSAKSAIGHLDAAAGVAGLIKATLALEHGLIPPTLHLRTPTPHIDWERSPFVVSARPEPWRTRGPRRAGVSSFGIGGTNAHLVLEQAPPAPASGPSRPQQLLVLSARTQAALEAASQRLARHLERHPEQPLADVAHTLQVGRKALPHRRVLVCAEAQRAAGLLASGDPEHVHTAHATVEGRPVAFMFPGGGAQYPDMGRELYESEPVFREHLEACAALLRRSGLELTELLYPAQAQAQEGARRLTRPSRALPALFCVEYALARLWMAWGIQPEAMVGHSMGEYVAACLAGVFSLEDALALVLERGRLFEQLPRGAMVSVALDEEQVRPLLSEHLSLAAVNGPAQCVVAGHDEALEVLVARLEADGVDHRRLHIDVAAHSHLIEPILPAFGAFLSRLKLHPPTRPLLSGVTGTWMTAEQATSPDYWVRHLRQPVRFAQGVHTLREDPRRVLLEVGPGRTLSSLARLGARHSEPPVTLASLRSPREEGSDVHFLLTTLGRLWLAGVSVPWERVSAHERRRRVVLPTYPFERKPHWLAPRPAGQAPGLDKRPDVGDWFYLPSWKRTLAPRPESRAQRWLVLADRHGLGARLARALEAAGHTVALATPGAGFRQAGRATFEVDPCSRQGLGQLLAALEREGLAPERIAHLGCVGEGDGGAEDALRQGFHSVLALGQALGEVPRSEPCHLVVVSTGVQSVTGHEALRPEKATVLGPCRVLPNELAGLTCRSVDVEPPDEGPRREQLVARLVAELTGPGEGRTVAWRGEHRWEQAFEPAPLPPSTSPWPRLRPQGTYLITGGLGGLGLVLAEHLARTVQARLVLVGRTPLPERSAWEGYLSSHPEDDALAGRLRALLALEAQGAQVRVFSADVADGARMRQVLEAARAEFGEPHGVIHAAGLPAGGLSQLRTPEQLEGVLRPKVQGTRVLEALLRDTPLDFLLLCSSRTAVVGELGQVDHCAANAFLDAFATERAAQGARHVLSLGWDTWREVGQAVTTALPAGMEQARARLLEHGLTRAEGVEVLGRTLAAQVPHLVVSTQELGAVLARGRGLMEDLTGATAPEEPPLPAHARVGADASHDEVRERLVDIWRRLLGVEQVGAHENFFELGGNSLIGLKVIADIKRHFGVDLPVVRLFENPTLGALARLLTRDAPQAAPAAAPELDERRGRGARRRERLIQRKLESE